jgi:hypothetical protein
MAGYAKIDQLVFTWAEDPPRLPGHHDAFQTKYAQTSRRWASSTEILEVQPLGADGAVVLGN